MTISSLGPPSWSLSTSLLNRIASSGGPCQSSSLHVVSRLMHPPTQTYARTRRESQAPNIHAYGYILGQSQPQRLRIRLTSLPTPTMPNLEDQYQRLLPLVPVCSRSWSHAGCEVITSESVARDAGHSRSRRPTQQCSDASSCSP
jgi:hypothetical protein